MFIVVNSNSNHTNKLRCVDIVSMKTYNQTIQATKCKTKSRSNHITKIKDTNTPKTCLPTSAQIDLRLGEKAIIQSTIKESL